MLSIGLDIGTTSICASLYDPEAQRQVALLKRANDSYLSFPEKWRWEQDPEMIWRACKELIDSFMNEYEDVACIGICGQMHGFLYLDACGQPLSNLVTWEDGRGNLEYCTGKSYADYLTEKTGTLMATGYALTTHFYNVVHKMVPSGAVMICTIMDYVAGRLTGSPLRITHYSNAASLGLFHVPTLCYCVSVMTALGIDRALLPESAAEQLVGTYRGAAVSLPIGDNQAGVLGVLQNQDDIVVSLGTSWQVSAAVDQLPKTAELDIRPFVQKQWLILDSGLCGGRSIQTLNDFFRAVCAPWATISRDDMYQWMGSALDGLQIEGDYPLVNTAFRGTRKAPIERASVSNLSLENFSPEKLVFGFYAGLCRDLADTVKKILCVKKSSGRIILTGNTAKKAPIVHTLLQHFTQMEVDMSTNTEEAALGAAKSAFACLSF